MVKVLFFKKTKGLLILLILLIAVSMLCEFSAGNLSEVSESPDSSFKTDKELLKVQLKEGENIGGSLDIANPRESDLKIEGRVKGVENLIELSELDMVISKGENRVIGIKYKGNASGLGVFTGSVILKSGPYEKIIPVIIEVMSKEVTTDVKLNINAENKEVLSGDKVSVRLDLFNIMKIEDQKTALLLEVKDLDGNSIAEEKEEVFVESQASFTRTIKIPEYVKAGSYIVSAMARNGDSVGTASEFINVVENKTRADLGLTNYSPLIIIVILILLVILGEMVYEAWKIKNIEKLVLGKSKEIYQKHVRERAKLKEKVKKAPETRKKEASTDDKIRTVDILKAKKDAEEKLKNQLLHLEMAHEGGYISKSAYLKGKERIRDYLKKISK